jgi:hypothetical protein
MTARRPTLQRCLVVAIALLAGGHVAVLALSVGADVRPPGLLTRLDLTREQSVGTWAAVGLLAVAALLAAAIAAVSGMPRTRRGWVVVAALLAVLSLDEVAALHEWAGEVVAAAVDRLPPALAYGWMLPAAGILVLLGLWQRRFLAGLPRPLARRLLLAAFVFVGGALGLELVESAMHTTTGVIDNRYLLVAGVEETLELVGAALVLLALLDHLALEAPAWRFDLRPTGITARPLDREVLGPWPRHAVRGLDRTADRRARA